MLGRWGGWGKIKNNPKQTGPSEVSGMYTGAGEGEDVIPQTWEHLLHLLDDPVSGHEAPQAMSLRGTVRALRASSQDGFIG